MKEFFEEVCVSFMSDVFVEANASIEIGMSGRDLFHLLEIEPTCAVFIAGSPSIRIGDSSANGSVDDNTSGVNSS
jgi:hypothetical protein